MFRRVWAVTLLLLGSGASAAESESARLGDETADMTYVAVAGCIRTIVSVQAAEQVVHSTGTPLRTRSGTVSIQIYDTCTDTEVLVANHSTLDPVYDQQGIVSARFHDEFTTDGHQVRIDVVWTAGDTTRRRIERVAFDFPDGIAHVSVRQETSDAVVSGALVLDGASTDLSAASGALAQRRLSRLTVTH